MHYLLSCFKRMAVNCFYSAKYATFAVQHGASGKTEVLVKVDSGAIADYTCIIWSNKLNLHPTNWTHKQLNLYLQTMWLSTFAHLCKWPSLCDSRGKLLVLPICRIRTDYEVGEWAGGFLLPLHFAPFFSSLLGSYKCSMKCGRQFISLTTWNSLLSSPAASGVKGMDLSPQRGTGPG